MTNVHSHHQPHFPLANQPTQTNQAGQASSSTQATPATTQTPAGSEAPIQSPLGSDQSQTHSLPSSNNEPNQVQFGQPSSPSAPPQMEHQDIGEPAPPANNENTPPSEGTAPTENQPNNQQPVNNQPESSSEPEEPRTSPQMQQLNNRLDRDGLNALDDPGVQALLRQVRENEDKNFKSLIDMLQKSLDRAREQQEQNKKDYNQRVVPQLKQAEKELNELKALEQSAKTQAAQQRV